MPNIIGKEIELIGSHGIQAHRYGAMLDMIGGCKIDPLKLVGNEITLKQAPEALRDMDQFQSVGVTVISDFS